MKVRTRFAPSPTGKLHLGGVRTALYNWLYARSCGGEMVLRIEDTDRERSTRESTQLILDSLAWLGLDYDLGPFYQTQRLTIYREYAERLVASGRAYRCYCSRERLEEQRTQQLAKREKPRYDGRCRDLNLPERSDQPYVIRFRNELTGTVTFEDQVLGQLSFQNQELDDLVIIRSDGTPTYNFCVVIDDLEMQITHVIRGADHINNTPRQINIFRALAANPPLYGHVPLILGRDGTLLSKRHGAASVLEYRDQGYLKEAVLNYLVRLGWAHGDQEIFSCEEMIQAFNIQGIHRAAAAFDPDKLLWLNRHYLKTLQPAVVAQHLIPQLTALQLDPHQGAAPEEVVVALRERSDTLQQMAEKSRCFYSEIATYPEELRHHFSAVVVTALTGLRSALAGLASWGDEELHQVLVEQATAFGLKLGELAQPVRIAITGTKVSPPINTTLRLIGKERVLQRLDRALVWSVSAE